MRNIIRFLFVVCSIFCFNILIGSIENENSTQGMNLNVDLQEKTNPSYSYYKKFKYETSLAYTKMTAGNWWTKIEPLNLYLGALPLNNKGHVDQIIDLGVTHVLSMVEDFELEDSWFNKPVRVDDWESRGLSAYHIQAIDFKPLTQDEIQKGVQYLAEVLESGNCAYVHCKAGRGRSATIVIVYLMQYFHLSFEEAYTVVKDQRPQINLNKEQRQAILNYFSMKENEMDEKAMMLFPQEELEQGESSTTIYYQLLQNANKFSEDSLNELLVQMLHFVIEGVSYSLDNQVPDILATWIPSIEIQSTIERRNRYLREYRGDQDLATEAAIKRNHGLIRRFKIMAASALPFLGTPTSQSISLWHQLREITLIAAIHGHDIHDPEVKMKIFSSLIGGDLLKIPAVAVDLVARKILKEIMIKAGINAASSIIPAHLIFNYFTSNSAKVATHAKLMFAGENSLPIACEKYNGVQ